jgi:hypothetical protein
MQHLTLEALARLVDEPPDPAEAAHVRDCLPCRRELEEMRAQTHALAALPDPEPPARAWAALEAELRREGLVKDIVPARRRLAGHPALRIAAAALVFLLGAGVGVALLGRGGDSERIASGDPVRAVPPRILEPALDPSIRTAASLPLPGEDPVIVYDMPAPEAESGARLASEGGGRAARTTMIYPRARVEARAPVSPPRQARAAAPRGAVTLTRAEWELMEAETAYLAALQRYAAAVDQAPASDPHARLDALERLLAATGAALERAPDDPVVNGYHMAALRERDEVRRQLARAQKTWF